MFPLSSYYTILYKKNKPYSIDMSYKLIEIIWTTFQSFVKRSLAFLWGLSGLYEGRIKNKYQNWWNKKFNYIFCTCLLIFSEIICPVKLLTNCSVGFNDENKLNNENFDLSMIFKNLIMSFAQSSKFRQSVEIIYTVFSWKIRMV